METRDFDKAIEMLEMAIGLDPEFAITQNNLAWILATCSDDQFRDGEMAVEHAKKACELSYWEESYCVGTLAAAYGEVGDFTKAIEMLEKAIELDPTYIVDKRQEMMGCFQKSQPYRDGIEKDR